MGSNLAVINNTLQTESSVMGSQRLEEQGYVDTSSYIAKVVLYELDQHFGANLIGGLG